MQGSSLFSIVSPAPRIQEMVMNHRSQPMEDVDGVPTIHGRGGQWGRPTLKEEQPNRPQGGVRQRPWQVLISYTEYYSGLCKISDISPGFFGILKDTLKVSLCM